MFYKEYEVGILGGGQLGQMLIEAAIKFNLQISVLDPDSEASCQSITHQFDVGSLQDFDTVYNFGKNKKLLTIEIEHVNTDALKKLNSEGVTIFPQPEIISLIQDKRKQKEFYKKNNIPTSEYQLIESKKDIFQHIDFLPAVQKLAYAGYDGKGVYKIQDQKDIEKAFDQPSVLEKKIDIEKEISIIIARNKKGEIVVYPAVELVFNPEYNLVDYLLSPARLSVQLEKQAKEIAITIAEKLKIVGLLAIELFITKENKILVNEIAPRPHNSGHHTIEGNFTSQFEQHWRAILNLPLGNTESRCFSGILNLLGEKNHTGSVVYEGLDDILKIKNTFIHLYGKKITKPFRKMGHITILGDSIEEVEKNIQYIKNKIRVIT